MTPLACSIVKSISSFPRPTSSLMWKGRCTSGEPENLRVPFLANYRRSFANHNCHALSKRNCACERVLKMRRWVLCGARRRQQLSRAAPSSTCMHSGAARRQWSSRAGASKLPSSTQSSSVSSGHSALQQQLGFCCLLCGWESACTSCPFDWYGFDPRKYRDNRRAEAAGPGLRASQQELQEAIATLGLAGRVDAHGVKAAFRAKALEWHPDCSDHENAESTFKEIVRAYELLLAAFPSSS